MATPPGRTSVVEALKAVIGGGHDATLVRQGADAGEVVIVFDDGTTATKTITPTGSKLTARHPTMGRISAPAGWLKAVTDQLWSPVEFIRSKGRVKMLLEAVPMPVDGATEVKIMEAIGPDHSVQIPAATAGHALHAIAAAHETLYRRRTDENRIARDAATHVEQLAGSLPKEEPETVDLAAIQAEHEELKAEETGALEVARDNRTQARLEASEKREETTRRAHEQFAEDTGKIAADYQEEAGQIQARFRHALTEISARRARETEIAAAAKQHANTLAVIDHNRQKMEVAGAASKSLTAALDRLRSLRGELIDRLPIEGMTIEDGEVHVGGIPFGRLNRAAQVRAAVAVAKARAGDVPLVVFDGLECLDPETLAAFEAEVGAAGLQAIVTRVTEGPLKVRGDE